MRCTYHRGLLLKLRLAVSDTTRVQRLARTLTILLLSTACTLCRRRRRELERRTLRIYPAYAKRNGAAEIRTRRPGVGTSPVS